MYNEALSICKSLLAKDPKDWEAIASKANIVSEMAGGVPANVGPKGEVDEEAIEA